MNKLQEIEKRLKNAREAVYSVNLITLMISSLTRIAYSVAHSTAHSASHSAAYSAYLTASTLTEKKKQVVMIKEVLNE